MFWLLKDVYSDATVKIDKDEFLVGRSPNMGLVCLSNVISRHHAVLNRENEKLFVMDLNSSNGTYVNNRLITKNERCSLKNCDEVGFGLCRTMDFIATKQTPPYYIYTVKLLDTNEPIVISDDESDGDLEMIQIPTKKPRLDDDCDEHVVKKMKIEVSRSISSDCDNTIGNSNINESLGVICIDQENYDIVENEPCGSKNISNATNVSKAVKQDNTTLKGHGNATPKEQEKSAGFQEEGKAGNYKEESNAVKWKEDRKSVNRKEKRRTANNHKEIENPVTLKEANPITPKEKEITATLDKQNVPTGLNTVCLPEQSSIAKKIKTEVVRLENPTTLKEVEHPISLKEKEIPATLDEQNVPTELNTARLPQQSSIANAKKIKTELVVTNKENSNVFPEVVEKPEKSFSISVKKEFLYKDETTARNLAVSIDISRLDENSIPQSSKDCADAKLLESNSVNNKKSVSSETENRDEPRVSNVTLENNNDFETSNDDHIMIVDDEEEDSYNFVCSQMFVKDEPLSQTDVDDEGAQTGEPQQEGVSDQVFANIKRELEIMDRLELDNTPLVTLDDTMNWCFDDSDDLGSPEDVANIPANISPKNVQPDDFNKSVNIEESIDIIHYANNNVETPSSDGSCSTDSNFRIDESKNASPVRKEVAYIAPMLFRLPYKRTTTTITTQPATEKEPTKVVPKVAPKTRRKKKSPAIKHTLQIDNFSTKDILEMRRKKLKELAEKNKVDDTNSNHKNNTYVPEDIPEDQNCRPSVGNKPERIRISRVPSSDTNNSNIPRNVIEPIPQRSSRRNQTNQENKTNSTNDRRSPRIAEGSRGGNNVQKNVRATNRPTRSTTLQNSNNLMQIPSTSRQDIHHYNSASRDPRLDGYNTRTVGRGEWQQRKWIEENFDVILTIIYWKTGWLFDEKRLQVLPQVSRKNQIRMCNTFMSYQDYLDVIQPLILAELWFTVCKEYETKKFKQSSTTSNDVSFICNILNTVKHKDFVELRCVSYLERTKREQQIHVQERSLVTLQYRSKSRKLEQSSSYVMIFGLVVCTKLEPLRPTDIIDTHMARLCNPVAETKLEFTVLIKDTNDDLILNSHVYGRIYNCFHQYLRLFSSLKSMSNGPLLKLILEPTLANYRMPYVPSRELISRMIVNSSQREAVLNATNLCMRPTPGLYLIEGPPGTGKTTVILNILMEILLRQNKSDGKCIMLLAPSNGAIDTLVIKINEFRNTLSEEDKRKIKMVRIGKRSAISPKVVPSMLESLAECNVNTHFFNEHPSAKRDYNILDAEVRQLQNFMKHNPTDTVVRKQLNDKMHQRTNFAKLYLKCRYQPLFDNYRINVLQKANLVCSTIGSCSKILSGGLKSEQIKLCIIDEATQSSESETLIPIGMGITKLLLVGDPQQLPAMTSSVLTKEFGYGNSLFSRLKYTLSKLPSNPIQMLNIQYRMNPEISMFPSNTYYKGVVQNCQNFKIKSGLEKLKPYMVFNQSAPNMNRYYNKHEVALVLTLIDAIMEVVERGCNLNVGIITPYGDQRDAINHSLRQKNFGDMVTCNTIDSFQGQEKDVILLSCVRDSTNSFVSDEQRLNVAITRAKYALYIIGTQSLFESCHPLRRVKVDAEKRNLYVNVTCHVQSVAAFSTLITKR